MTEIYLSRLTLNVQSRAVWNDLGNLQQLHRTVSNAFEKIENADDVPHHLRKTPRNQFNVLHRLDFDRRTGQAVLLVQSSGRKPNWDFLREGYATEIKCKAVHEQFAQIENGTRLLFRLQANPTKRVGARYEHPDAAKREEFARKFRDEKNRRRIALNKDEEKIEWLERKSAECGFHLTRTIIKDEAPNAAAVAQSKIKSSRGKSGERPMTFGSVVFEGVLEVTDAEKFRETLIKGIGSGKAYGFGLLSIAPVKEA